MLARAPVYHERNIFTVVFCCQTCEWKVRVIKVFVCRKNWRFGMSDSDDISSYGIRPVVVVVLTLGEKTRDRREVADAGTDEWEVTGSQSCGYNSHAKLVGEVLAWGISLGCPIDRDSKFASAQSREDMQKKKKKWEKRESRKSPQKYLLLFAINILWSRSNDVIYKWNNGGRMNKNESYAWKTREKAIVPKSMT